MKISKKIGQSVSSNSVLSAREKSQIFFVLYSRCGGAVYEAEKLTVKDDVYHKVKRNKQMYPLSL